MRKTQYQISLGYHEVAFNVLGQFVLGAVIKERQAVLLETSLNCTYHICNILSFVLLICSLLYLDSVGFNSYSNWYALNMFKYVKYVINFKYVEMKCTIQSNLKLHRPSMNTKRYLIESLLCLQVQACNTKYMTAGLLGRTHENYR